MNGDFALVWLVLSSEVARFGVLVLSRRLAHTRIGAPCATSGFFQFEFVGIAIRAAVVAFIPLAGIVLAGFRTPAEVILNDASVVTAALGAHHATARQSSTTRRKIGRTSSGARK